MRIAEIASAWLGIKMTKKYLLDFFKKGPPAVGSVLRGAIISALQALLWQTKRSFAKHKFKRYRNSEAEDIVTAELSVCRMMIRRPKGERYKMKGAYTVLNEIGRLPTLSSAFVLFASA